MSRFNPNLDKSPREWGAIALRDNLSDRSGHLIVAGIVGGGLLASATTPLLGGVLAAYCIVKGLQSAFASDKNKKLITDIGCIAHVLKPADFRAYRRQVGDEKILEELQYADDEGMPLSIDAVEFLEEYFAKVPVALPPVQATEATKLMAANTTTTEIDNYDVGSSVQIDIINEMTERITNTLIVGIPGSGKGMLVANALRVAKEKHSDLKIFVIDPKADADESGYFDGVVDKIKRYKCENEADEIVVAWVENCFNEYYEYVNQNGRTLLFLDEGMAVGSAAERLRNPILQNKVSSIASLGDKSGKNIWIATQSPFVGGLGIKLSASSQMLVIAIINEANLGAFKQWSRSSILEKVSTEELAQLIKYSPANRAVYFGKNAKWYSMPHLHNYSNFDRDTRTYINGYVPPSKADKLVSDKKTINHLEQSLKSELNPDNKTQDKQLSELATRLLSFFENAKNKEPKTLADIKKKDELREQGDVKLIVALTELVNAGKLNFDDEDSWSKFDW